MTDTMGDDHAKGWVLREFARHGISFKARPTGMDRSALYLETLPLFSAGRVRLLDSKRLVSQYLALERTVLPAGGQRVNHPNRTGYHDDVANACSGAIWRVNAEKPRLTGDYFRMQIERSNARAAAQRMGVYGSEWGWMGERAYSQRMRRMSGG